MEINTQSIHFSASGALLEFVEKKISKLENVNQKVVSADVYLRLEKSEEKENKISEIKLNVPGHTLFAKEQCNSFEESVDLAVESLKKQLQKAKEKEMRR
jgi:putative sigma-54 modulation protein